MLLESFEKICREECRLSTAAPVLVGVSGGPDSLCLLDLLARAGYGVIVAHFHHGLRPEADEDALAVQNFARIRGMAFVTERQDIAALARDQHLSLEEAARIGRYRFLFEQARRAGAQAVAVGHTADDQVETVLMHLLRGAGLGGLKGMTFRAALPEWDANLPLVRPLLHTWRKETVSYCEELGLSPVFDLSNLNTTFFRNRLRHDLIPYLQGYNPQIKEVLWRTSQSLAGDLSMLEEAVQAAWEQVEVRLGQGFVSLSLPVFRSFSAGLMRRVLRRAVACLRPSLRDVDFEVVERGVQFACLPSRSGEMDLLQGLRLSIQEERLLVSEESVAVLEGDYPQMPAGQELFLNIPEQVELRNGWHLRASFEMAEEVQKLPGWGADPAQAWLDADLLELPLRVRTVHPGERFEPLGMNGHSLKLSDFWVNEHLTRQARAGWPLVFSGDRLAWVPFFRPAHPFRVTGATLRMVHLQVMRK
jgi:tRNA(Ile)-lysidine synthase